MLIYVKVTYLFNVLVCIISETLNTYIRHAHTISTMRIKIKRFIIKFIFKETFIFKYIYLS